MKLGRISGVAVFLGAALGGALLARPAVAYAGGVFRQYSPQMCVFAGSPSDYHVYDPTRGGPANYDVSRATLFCPLVEDESVHVKGGATAHFIMSELLGNGQSMYGLCKTFESQSGGTCGSWQFTEAKRGVRTYTATSANFWASSTDFGYLDIEFGAMAGGNYIPNVVQGYWVSN